MWRRRRTRSHCTITRKLRREPAPASRWLAAISKPTTYDQRLTTNSFKMTETLKISNLHVAVGGKPILHGVNLTIRRGETHALMGPNGSGKSTLAGVIMGHPNYEVTDGTIELNGENILDWDATERARAGIFMAFQ